MKYEDIMIDIETLGTDHDAVITQIGLVIFNRDTGEMYKQQKVNVDIQSCINQGMTMIGDTLIWWFNQDDVAIKKVYSLDLPRIHVYKALEILNQYLHKDMKVWCDATFDAPILSNAFKKCGITPNWMYRNVRDLRTLFDLYGKPETEREGTHHDALDDARHQVKCVVEVLDRKAEVRFKPLKFPCKGDKK